MEIQVVHMKAFNEKKSTGNPAKKKIGFWYRFIMARYVEKSIISFYRIYIDNILKHYEGINILFLFKSFISIRDVITGDDFFIKCETVEEALKLFKVKAALGLGQIFKLIEPEFTGKVFETLKILKADTPLLPSDVTVDRLFLNQPIVEQLSAEKCLKSFMVVGKPKFSLVRLRKGCGSTFCNSVHLENPNRMCPGLTGNAHSKYFMSANVKVDDFSAKVTMNTLAEYFVEENTLLKDKFPLNGLEDLVRSVAERSPEKSWLIGGWTKKKFQEGAAASDGVAIHITSLKCIANVPFDKFAGGIELSSSDDDSDNEEETANDAA